MNFIATRSELHGSSMLLHFTNSYNSRFERALEKLNCLFAPVWEKHDNSAYFEKDPCLSLV